jgi:hypothetical protein
MSCSISADISKFPEPEPSFPQTPRCNSIRVDHRDRTTARCHKRKSNICTHVENPPMLHTTQSIPSPAVINARRIMKYCKSAVPALHGAIMSPQKSRILYGKRRHPLPPNYHHPLSRPTNGQPPEGSSVSRSDSPGQGTCRSARAAGGGPS